MREDVPELLRLYVARCVPDASRARGVRLRQEGTIRLDPTRPWSRFTARQTFDAHRTAFVWRARVRMAPLTVARVVDAYEDGRGRLDARLWGVLPVARERGADLDVGEAQRYLAELPWNPLAVLHNPELRFEELGDRQIRVSLAALPAASVDLRFDEGGLLVGARTEARSRGGIPQPWEGRFEALHDFGGVWAPARGEVWWDPPGNPFPYWRGRITHLTLL